MRCSEAFAKQYLKRCGRLSVAEPCQRDELHAPTRLSSSMKLHGDSTGC